MRRPNTSRSAAKVALVYLGLGIFWIYFSDLLLLKWFSSANIQADMTHYQTLKGWLFIAFTAVLLYLLVQRALRSLVDTEQSLKSADLQLDHLLSTNRTVLYCLEANTGKISPRWASESARSVFGYSTEEIMKPDWWINHVHPEDREQAISSFNSLFEKGTLDHHYRFLSHEGKVFWVHDKARLIRNEEGYPQEIIGSWIDISEQRKISERDRLFSAAFDTIAEAILVTDPQIRILSVNKAAVRMFGYGEDELLGITPGILKSGRHDENFFSRMWEVLQQDHEWHGEIWNRSKNGDIKPQWLSVRQLLNAQGEPEKYVTVYTDISELKHTESELQFLALHDALTRLPNRIMLEDFIALSIQQAKRIQSKIAVLFIDLVDFKSINDSLGHHAGDELLLAIAARLKNRIRAEDRLGRHGGDEFALLTGHMQGDECAGVLANDLLEILGYPFELADGRRVYLEACIGIAVYPDNGDDAAAILRAASTALLSAKQAGRNTHAFYSREMGLQVFEQLQLETELRQSIVRGELRLVFQPKVACNGAVSGMEALLRWSHPELGDVPPGRFIQIAEKSQLILQLGNWLILETSRQVRHWLDSGIDPKSVAFNTSIKQFRGDSDIVNGIRTALDQFAIPPHLLTLEITESALMDNAELVRLVLLRLKEMGLRISLDDFGTGFSNMAYLSRLPLDELKIDISFIRNIGQDSQSDNLVRSVITLAQSLGLSTVAEGVENEAQHRFLAQYGCDQLQGFRFSKPLEIDEMTALLRKDMVLPNDGRG